MSTLKYWLLASRPKTLPAAATPVVVGSALALRDGGFHAVAAAAALGAALLIQVGTNLANDYFDFRQGADPVERLGPTRVTSAGLLPARAVAIGTVVVFLAAALLGLVLVARGGWPILLIGIASIIAGVAYTGGPFPLGYNGLGDLFVFLFFGLVAVPGSYYVQTLALTPAAFVAAVPIGALATAILVVNNVRDVESDARVGKRTAAVLFGLRAARAEFVLLVAVAFLTPLLMPGLTSPARLLPLLALPLARGPLRAVLRSGSGQDLNRALAATARLLALFGLLFSIALLL